MAHASEAVRMNLGRPESKNFPIEAIDATMAKEMNASEEVLHESW